jgi:hypothetical protein
MRHKILFLLEQELAASPVMLDGVCEDDETYVLESEKGHKFAADHYRKPRKRGGKASKRGLSSEQVCICASVNADRKCLAKSVNRATPSKAELERVFSDRILDDTVILCDGNKNYDVFEGRCTVAHVKHPNKVNGFHSFMNERLRTSRGVATKYQNRYNALFSEIYGTPENAVNRIIELVTSPSGTFLSNHIVESRNLLSL